jgi:coenzyme F420-0:L-glutamate ligase / coenzyme F420-1:gamma-L-glutamate ligase
MSIKQAIKQRRSIRKYQPKPVSKKIVFEVLEAAGWAPSAHNVQPWQFIVVSDFAVKKRLAEEMAVRWLQDLEKDKLTIEKSKREAKTRRFIDAPVLIVACLNMEGMHCYPDVERQLTERDLAVESLGAAMQNLLLAAEAAGVGACWFSAPSFCKDVVRNVLEIPESVEPQAMVTLGFPDEQPLVPNRKPLAQYCFENKWGKALV